MSSINASFSIDTPCSESCWMGKSFNLDSNVPEEASYKRVQQVGTHWLQSIECALPQTINQPERLYCNPCYGSVQQLPYRQLTSQLEGKEIEAHLVPNSISLGMSCDQQGLELDSYWQQTEEISNLFHSELRYWAPLNHDPLLEDASTVSELEQKEVEEDLFGGLLQDGEALDALEETKVGSEEQYFHAQNDWMNAFPDSSASLEFKDSLIFEKKGIAVSFLVQNESEKMQQCFDKKIQKCEKSRNYYLQNKEKWKDYRARTVLKIQTNLSELSDEALNNIKEKNKAKRAKYHEKHRDEILERRRQAYLKKKQSVQKKPIKLPEKHLSQTEINTLTKKKSQAAIRSKKYRDRHKKTISERRHQAYLNKKSAIATQTDPSEQQYDVIL